MRTRITAILCVAVLAASAWLPAQVGGAGEQKKPAAKATENAKPPGPLATVPPEEIEKLVKQLGSESGNSRDALPSVYSKTVL